MAEKPAPRNLPQRSLLEASRQQTNIMKVIVDVNNLVAFKMTPSDFKDWAIQIHRIAPDIDLKAVRFMMDCFATEALVYDHTKGIQNIFNALRKIERTDDGKYRIKSVQSYL